MSNLGKFEGNQAFGAENRVALFQAGLVALMSADEGSFIIFGCSAHPDAFVQFAWLGSALRGEVGGVQASPDVAAALAERGFAPPAGDLPNFAAEFPEPDAPLMGRFVEEIFTQVLGCPPDYTASVEAAEPV
jgi:hypothetical protein